MTKANRNPSKAARRAKLVSVICDKMTLPGKTRAQVRKVVDGTINKWCHIGVTGPAGDVWTMLDIDLLKHIASSFKGGDHMALEGFADRAWGSKYTLG